jgi:MFS family permease
MNYRFVVPMMATAFFELTVISVVRVTTSYRAIELGLSAAWIGIITAAFAILPVFLALKVGRSIDRGNDLKMIWAGTALLVAACLGMALFPSIHALLFFTAALGTGHLLLSIGLQVLCAQQPGPGVMERMLGNYMIATAVGQGVGPAVVGWVGGSAAIPPTQPLFWIGLAMAALAFLSSLLLRSSYTPAPHVEGSRPMPVRDIVRSPGFAIVWSVSVVAVVAQDLIVVYLPLMGTERNIAVDVIGSLLAVRAFAAVVSRLFFAKLSMMLGSSKLMIASTVAGALAFAALAAPISLPLMYASIAVLGAALGVAVTTAISGLLGLVDSEVRGTANSLRTGGTRLGQVIIPFLAGVLATAMGVASVFLVLGASLAMAATAVQFTRAKSSSS